MQDTIIYIIGFEFYTPVDTSRIAIKIKTNKGNRIFFDFLKL